MEIMVVIIVIAVLASVAGPMIGSITDQGRASATKSKLSSLKSALLAYQTDVGRVPHLGCARTASQYDQDLLLSADCEDKNVLYSNSIAGWAGACKPGNYSRRWKGPYMDSDPSDFMFDSWGNKIRYLAFKKNVYLWSAGADGSFASCVETAFKNQGCSSSEDDDIVVSVLRTKFTMGGAPHITASGDD